MKTINKRILSFVLALVMALGMASFAFAATPGVGYAPPDDRQLWWQTLDATTGFEYPFTLTLPNPDPDDPELDITYQFGLNTIEEFILEDGNFYLVIHPQYLPETDDPVNADYSVSITSLKVDVGGGVFEEFQRGDLAEIPYAYMQGFGTDYPYLLCEIEVFILGISTAYTGSVTLDNVYLEIPREVF
jgi:hypothetical protein